TSTGSPHGASGPASRSASCSASGRKAITGTGTRSAPGRAISPPPSRRKAADRIARERKSTYAMSKRRVKARMPLYVPLAERKERRKVDEPVVALVNGPAARAALDQRTGSGGIRPDPDLRRRRTDRPADHPGAGPEEYL